MRHRRQSSKKGKGEAYLSIIFLAKNI
jgi:hypothetical protein